MTRVAFITNTCLHYRRPLFERLHELIDVDFFFFSGGQERYHNQELTRTAGSFRERDVRRVEILGQPLIPGLPRMLAKGRYDVVVKCLNGKLMLPYVYLAAKSQRLPIVLWTGMWHHPETLAHQLSRPLVEGMYRGADALVVYGDHVRRFLKGVRGVSGDKIFVAGQAVDGARFGVVARGESGRPIVLYVGQFEERKGVAHLLRAIDLLGDVQSRFVFIGNGPLQHEIERHAERDARLEIIGHVPQSELPSHLATARCLVLPSITTTLDREPWGLVVNEAMHAGVPVVATTAVGAAAGGLVREGANGRVVPERDPAALASALRSLIEQPGRAAAYGVQARADVGEFSYERMAHAFVRAATYAVSR